MDSPRLRVRFPVDILRRGDCMRMREIRGGSIEGCGDFLVGV